MIYSIIIYRMGHIKEFFNLKNAKAAFGPRGLALMGVMLACAYVLNSVATIYITPSYRLVSIAYLPDVITGALLGPWAALAFGFAADTVKYLAKPAGPWFPGYALSEMATCFIYAAAFYKREKTGVVRTVLRALLAQLAVLIFVTMGLNYLWDTLMYGGKASEFFAAGRMINRAAQYPAHAALVAATARLAYLISGRTGLFKK